MTGKTPYSDRHAFGIREKANLGLITYNGRLLHGPTRDQVIDLLMKEQNGRCAICSDFLETPHLDHNHTTMEVRGLLCHGCNTGLGHFRDNPDILAHAIEYLTE